ncbi:hypothetical protein ACFSL6_04150 [Paenibacillus thailandensis]|uniref:SpoIIIAH-like family protein n=1 Tax=Paenibacillus thailandensis TaxID=393250 RepID=A0ABW5QZ79_9BACL
MVKDAFKWIAVGGALVFVVLYGLEVSTSGIERIYGPIEGAAASAVGSEPAGAEEEERQAERMAETDAAAGAAVRIAELEKELKEIKRLAEREAIAEGIKVEEDDSPAINRLADGTADLLESVTTGGIRFVVSLFDSVTN